MSINTMIGIDAGGTHTDAVLIGQNGNKLELLAQAKVQTQHDALHVSVEQVINELAQEVGGKEPFASVSSVTLGTTLAVNALVQDRADPVGLALSAGPGLDPQHFTLGEYVCIVPGGLDHRGVQVSPLDLHPLQKAIQNWQESGIKVAACVGKFSPRNPAHEQAMSVVAEDAGLHVTRGHRLSGQLNFPRRIATAYYNAAVARVQNNFLDAVERTLHQKKIRTAIRLLKADGGSVSLPLARREPVQSVLSGPAASVMGVLALCSNIEQGCCLLLDVGGTTTDIALLAEGSPVLDRDGMLLRGRRTLVRSLASISIGVGGDSRIDVEGSGEEATIQTGPFRDGVAMAFGGTHPTLLDALNTLDGEQTQRTSGQVQKSIQGIGTLAIKHGIQASVLAQKAVDSALEQIRKAVNNLLQNINAKPIYTLAALRKIRTLQPERVLLVGGPAECLQQRLQEVLQKPVEIPAYSAVANAVGAALTLPTAGLELYADTGRKILRVPILDHEESISGNYKLEDAKRYAQELLKEYLAESGTEQGAVEVLEADLFATLDDRGYGSHDIRVVCQAVPGIVGKI